ncbi:ABC transporter permease [Mesorhizobium intechi]|uniref:ABC transporter permease n=1 Tax=Mesorhizobium intechi TaxID=537601 RepID=UPI001FEA0591|nr:ABC transporter permease [Mesorhizobium intechi]
MTQVDHQTSPAVAQNVARTAVSSGRKESAAMRFLRRWGTIVVIVLAGLGFALASPYFATVSNLNNVLFSMIVSALVSMGLTWVVMAGSFDLSIGLTVTTSSILVAFLMPVVGPWLAIVIALAAACVIGLVNGVLVTYGRLSGIVVTLGVMFVLDGINVFITGGYQVPIDYGETAFLYLGQGKLGTIGVPVIILLVIFALALIAATRTRIGHYIAAVGDNPMAAFYSGINVYRWVILAFVLSAFMSGIAGIIVTSISSSAQPVGGEGYLLEAFAAVFLGATVLGKGKPHVLGTLVGVFFLYMVDSGMNMVGFPFAARHIFQGLVLIVAVGANALLNREEVHLKFI